MCDRSSIVLQPWHNLVGADVGCAECHDHKYDPITQVDFYRFYALFNNADEFNIDADDVSEKDQQAFEDFYQWRTERLANVRRELDQLLSAWEDKLLWTEGHPGADHRWDTHLEVLGLIWGQAKARPARGPQHHQDSARCANTRRTSAIRRILLSTRITDRSREI